MQADANSVYIVDTLFPLDDDGGESRGDARRRRRALKHANDPFAPLPPPLSEEALALDTAIREERALLIAQSKGRLKEGHQRVRLLVAYHGAPFHGVAIQPKHKTVAGVIRDALHQIAKYHPDVPLLVVAGRTDAGVHGWGQVMHVDLLPPRGGIDCARLKRSLNKMLAPHVVIRAVDIAPEGDFHARFSAISRSYRYTVLNRAEPDPFLSGLVWHVERPLDLSAMRLACDPFMGRHDFSSFCKVPKDDPDPSMIRVITSANWVDLGNDILRFDVEATSFCQQMVRAIVGLMVDVGLGRRSAGEVLSVLNARDRSRGVQPAPAHGLCLWDVGYPPELAFPVATESMQSKPVSVFGRTDH